MRKLHLVGFTPDGDGLVLTARRGSKSGGYVIALDGELQKVLADVDRRRDGAGAESRGMPERQGRLSSPRLVRPDSALSPREMQDRIRAGWTVEDVAAEAGVDLDWVNRFAAPVLAEIGRVLDEVRTVAFDRPRVGTSGLALAPAVRRNLFDRGVVFGEDVDPDEGWSAFQVDDDRWVVRFEYRSRGRLQVAEWIFDAVDRSLVARNRLATQLAYVAPRRERAAAPAPRARKAATRKAATRKAGTRKAATRKAATRKGASKKATARKSTARKVAARKTPAKKAGARKAATRRRAQPPAAPAPLEQPVPPRRPDPPRPSLPTGPPVPPPRPAASVRPVPGAVAVDPVTGIARIDSRRGVAAPTFRPAAPPPPPPRPALAPRVFDIEVEEARYEAPARPVPTRASAPVFRDDVDVAGTAQLGNRGPLPPPPPVRRRRAPLRASPE